MARKTKTKSTKKSVRTRTRKAAKAKPRTVRAARGGAARKAVKRTSAQPERLKMRQKKHLSKSTERSTSTTPASGYVEKPGQSVASRSYEATGQGDNEWATQRRTVPPSDKDIQEG